MTLTGIAEVLSVAEDDLRVVLGWMDVDAPEDELPKDVGSALHRMLNPNQERTVAERYIPDIGPDWRK